MFVNNWASMRSLTGASRLPLRRILGSSLPISVSRKCAYSTQLSKDKKTILDRLDPAPDAEGLKYYQNTFQQPQIAVVKVGGAVITDSLGELVSALKDLHKSNLIPVIVHGGGPQMNQRLESEGVEPVYEQGMRVTDKATLKIAEEVFQSENDKVVQALKTAGVSAQGFVGDGMLQGKYLDFAKWKYVGKITSINQPKLRDLVKSKIIPVIASLAAGDEGYSLNVNADVVAAFLARSLQPLNTVYLSPGGGIFDDQKQLLPEINLKRDWDMLMAKPWVKFGTKLKIEQVRDILADATDGDAKVNLTSPQHLRRILVNDLAQLQLGTTVHKGEQTTESSSAKKRIGIIGARGYVGRELMRIIQSHPNMDIACVSSRQFVGQRVCDTIEGVHIPLKYTNLSPDELGTTEGIDAWVLALPNGLSETYVTALQGAHQSKGTMPVVVDLSADNRFTDKWTYGLPERYRSDLTKAKLISNPGCYATGAQLSILPLKDSLASPPVVFGVSGYSGAGTNPSPKNDPAFLKDNLIPYALSNHIHEREVTRQVGQNIHFTPHVASWFQGISLTTNIQLSRPTTSEEVFEIYKKAYEGEPLIKVTKDVPLVRDNAGKHHVCVGGFEVSATDPSRVVVVSTLDNLLKGAATQCVQNLNLALGLEETAGISTE
ncbi:hypothetical protein SARC_06777 [Sphaeroforma arctica JP610]|uniref:Semialdehyde dehydrogenase NAD-binding domain-containing protein n=1 Tax=Sphaeroforma arctica JP610 TaxID=667725 RepID=A0A0L0FY41_9EUKA|nr:hypothetical protein SARC_06777 [Sphaeroforma arctica JP610]KNC80878.1 hypothetical protein SARC_06777 [Sphaeroforma arctica JP610]|eukprot:XP_014154780.1 hypothetical protein SARC_06777 [Sphaeroforma arctica JP610]